MLVLFIFLCISVKIIWKLNTVDFFWSENYFFCALRCMYFFWFAISSICQRKLVLNIHVIRSFILYSNKWYFFFKKIFFFKSKKMWSLIDFYLIVLCIHVLTSWLPPNLPLFSSPHHPHQHQTLHHPLPKNQHFHNYLFNKTANHKFTS